jgi:hypothetical protein
MRYTVEKNFVNVIGKIWMPAVTCAVQYNLDKHAVENIGDFTRENIRQWVDTNCGDFQYVDDFEATIGDKWISWKSEESELTFNDCMAE